MATPDSDAYVAAQNGAASRAVADLRRHWARIEGLDPTRQRASMDGYWSFMLARHGEITATLAADRFEEITGLPGVMVRPVDAERADARMRWAMGPSFEGDPARSLARLEGLTDELVKQPGRSTLIASAAAHRLKFARIPVGETCAFCLMLGSRGFVYESRESAGERRAFHGDCDCRIAVEGEDVGDYNPEALYEQYLSARAAAGDSSDPKDILAAWRERGGVADRHLTDEEKAARKAARVSESEQAGPSIDGLSDSEAEELMSRLMGEGDFDGAERVGELLDARASTTPQQVAEQVRDMGQDFHPAAYEWFEGLGEDEQSAYLAQFRTTELMNEFLQEQWAHMNAAEAAKLAQSAGRGIPDERTIRGEWEDYLYAESLRIEEATNGVMLSKKARADGRTVMDILRLSTDTNAINERTVKAWASDELLEYFDRNGRFTYASFKAGYTGDTEAIRLSRKTYWAG